MNIFKKSIACATLAAGLFVSLSSNAYYAMGGADYHTQREETSTVMLLSTFTPVIGPLLAESGLPESEWSSLISGQAEFLLNGGTIQTGNVVAAMAQVCAMDIKTLADAIVKIHKADSKAALTCQSIKAVVKAQ
jgi:hypothetical protein